MKEWLHIDGSQGEGGGQILRTSLAMSILTETPIQIHRIRAGRPKAGLAAQHLTCVEAAATICSAQVQGARLGSQEMSFQPGEVSAGKYVFRIGTAGSVGLVLHAVYLPLMLRGQASSYLTITGGTHVSHAPCLEFLTDTWTAFVRSIGLEIQWGTCTLGFYPKGGGRIELELKPSKELKPLRWPQSAMTNEKTTEIQGFAIVAGLPRSIGERMAKHAQKRLHELGVKANIAVQERVASQPGAYLILQRPSAIMPLTFSGLGQRGKRAEAVADEAVDALIEHGVQTDWMVDPHSADQMVLPLSFATGSSSFLVSKVTQHLLTNIDVIQRFVDRSLECSNAINEPGVVLIH